MRIARSLILPLLAALLVQSEHTRARTPKPPLCPPGRYLVDGDPLVDPATVAPDVVAIAADGTVSIASGCAAVAGKRKATRKGTRLSATWQEEGCPDVAGKVRLKARIDPTCLGLAGTLKARRASPKIKRPFTAVLSTCGDGVLDAAGGEECESTVDCDPGEQCTTCACTGGSSSTTTTMTTVTTTSVIVTTSSLATTTTTSTSTTTTTFPDTPPPDPSTVAPSLDPGVATSVGAASAFLYSGPTLIQFGVAPGTIAPHRAVVLRGVVRERDGGVLPAVLVRVRNHPELGATLTRTDGRFDLAVNGGGSLVLDYEKDGYLPAQRQLELGWGEFVTAPDIALVPLDPAVTAVDLSAGTMQVARGSEVSDDDGTRRATILVPPGTGATLVLPDGTEQAIGDLSVRATEYTVGDGGPDAMPGVLPPTSGYTYAVELSADEALAVGATDVRFDQPLPFYVENFLGFPVGGIVPTGYYDRERSVWVPSENGRVIRVLGATGGVADLDTDGDDVADDGAALGITTEERERLATLYAPDTTLWRVPVSHFTPWDCNWPYGPPPGAQGPNQPNLQLRPRDQPCTQPGSLVACQDQTLIESLPVTGAPFEMHYRSDRVPGRLDAYRLEIPLSGPTLPPALKRIDLEVRVAGQFLAQSFPASPNQTTTFTWNGLDTYGRLVQGEQRVDIRIGYVFDAVYAEPAAMAASFATFSNQPGMSITGNPARAEVTIWQKMEAPLGVLDARTAGLGGWTLGVHHAFDPEAGVLHLGNGERRSADNVGAVIRTVGGRDHGPSVLYCGVDGPATSGCIAFPWGVAVAPDGSVYVAAHDAHRVLRIDPAGILRLVAGRGPLSSGIGGYGGDGGPATAAQFYFPSGIALGPDGSLYIADRGNGRIRRVGSDGIVDTVVQYNGGAGQLAVGPDGALYFWEAGNGGLLRRRDPSGAVTTIAGGASTRCEDCPATSTLIGFTLDSALAVDADGGVYFTDPDDHTVRRVGPDGIVRRIAGISGDQGSDGDGGPARSARLYSPEGLTVGPDGSVYITDNNLRIRRVSPYGTITTVAGNGTYGFSVPDAGVSARAGTMTTVRGLAFGPDGSLYFADQSINRVRRMAGNLPRAGDLGRTVDADLFIPSERGDELYAFDAAGRHLLTLDAVTGAVRYAFEYAQGGLARVTDAAGLVTTVERGASGAPLAIVAPGGQRTQLTQSASGFLESVRNPAGETVQLTHGTDGLLTSLRDATNGEHRFTYDALGRLIEDEDPAGGTLTLDRSEAPGQRSVSVQSALGRLATYLVEALPEGSLRLGHTDAAGLSVETITDGGSWAVTHPDGTAVTVLNGPDPRFGMSAPLLQRLQVDTPAGRTLLLEAARTAILADPNDALSLRTLTNTVRVNTRQYTSTFDAPTRRTVSRTPAGREVTTTLDAAGRLVEGAVAGLHPVRFVYDAEGRLAAVQQGAAAEERTLAAAYDAQGRVGSVTDPLGRSVAFTYDAADRIVQALGSDGAQVDLAYDARGNPTSIAPPGRAPHLLGFNPVDLLASYTPPGGGGTTYSHDADRRLITLTRADGDTIAFGLDAAGRLATRTTPLGTDTFSYDPATGNLASIAGPDGTVAFDYDGFLETGETWSGTVGGAVTRTFDDDMRVTEVAVNGDVVDVRYDADNLVTGAGILDVTHSTQNGLVTGTTAGVVTTTQAHDGFAERTTFDAAANGVPVLAIDYTRDGLGRLATKVETVQGMTETIEYAYDASGRLAEVRRNGSVIASYAYDANGNRIERDEGGGPIAATYDGDDRLLSDGGTTFTHTADGELSGRTASGQQTTYAYDALGNLVTVALPGGPTIDYVVDGNGRRIGKRVDGVLEQAFLWDGTRPIAELDGMGQVVSRFVYATHPHVPDLVLRGGETYRIVADHLGSPRLVVNVATGAVAQRLRYDAFGNVEEDTAPGFQPFGFAGGLYDPDTELVRFGARDYDLRSGRWTARDPILFLGQDTNLYLYAYGDPVNFVDPDGLAPVWAKNLSNFIAGFGDTLSFGLSKWARDGIADAFDLGPTVYPCQSGFYTGGQVAGALYGLALGKAAPPPAGAGAAAADLNWAAIAGRAANARAGRHTTVNRAFDSAFGVSF